MTQRQDQNGQQQQDNTNQQGGTSRQGKVGQQGGAVGQDGDNQQTGSGQQNAGQQQQWDTQDANQGGRQSGGANYADQIRKHMHVHDAEGNHVGQVDSIDGDRIKLTRSDSADGQHHYVPLHQISGIQEGTVRLSSGAESNFGMESDR